MLKINGEITGIIALLTFLLPTVVAAQWTDNFHPMLHLTADQQITRRIAAVHQMLTGQAFMFGELLVNDGQRFNIGLRSASRFDMGNEIGRIIIAGFRQMHPIPRPTPAVSTGGEMGIGVIGTVTELAARG